jgi:hypothetical protein
MMEIPVSINAERLLSWMALVLSVSFVAALTLGLH